MKTIIYISIYIHCELGIYVFAIVLLFSMNEKFEDTKGVIRSRKSK